MQKNPRSIIEEEKAKCKALLSRIAQSSEKEITNIACEGLEEMLRTSMFPVRMTKVLEKFNPSVWFERASKASSSLAKLAFFQTRLNENEKEIAQMLCWEEVIEVVGPDLLKILGIFWFSFKNAGIQTDEAIGFLYEGIINLIQDKFGLTASELDQRLDEKRKELSVRFEGVAWSEILRLPEVF